jgi:hypothetical protein
MPLICCFALLATPVAAFPVRGSQTVLPAGTELNEDALDRPREVFRSEAIGGRKPYLMRQHEEVALRRVARRPAMAQPSHTTASASVATSQCMV